jgi:hypothetical protein
MKNMYKLTTKYQHSKHLKNGKRRSLLLYFLNDVLIFKQKIPFDENMEYGISKWHINNEFLFNGRIYQTRFDKNKIRNVSFPISKKLLTEMNIPLDIKITVDK